MIHHHIKICTIWGIWYGRCAVVAVVADCKRLIKSSWDRVVLSFYFAILSSKNVFVSNCKMYLSIGSKAVATELFCFAIPPSLLSPPASATTQQMPGQPGRLDALASLVVSAGGFCFKHLWSLPPCSLTNNQDLLCYHFHQLLTFPSVILDICLFFAEVPFGIAQWGRTRVGMCGQMRPLEQLGGVFPTNHDRIQNHPLFFNTAFNF